MGFFGTLKEVITNKPSTLREPTFFKEFNENNDQFKVLEEFLKVAPEEKHKQIEQDIKLLSCGMAGEKNVAFELKNSHMPILILHDLYLKYNDLTAQIDFVVINPRFLLVVECKNMVGDIQITSTGEFRRYFKGPKGKTYKPEGMYSPIVQNERHVELIKDILKAEEDFGEHRCSLIKQLVVIANPKTIINSRSAKKEIKEHIIKHDQLINKMKELAYANKDGYWFTEEKMYSIANTLLKYNSTYAFDYKKKYGNLFDNDEKFQLSNKDITYEEPMEKTPLYKELRKYRLDKSREENVKPYFLYSNLQLEALVKAKPKNVEELRKINGFGNVKCERYGRDIVEIVNKNC
ncbi:NERD domain-containing protein [Clostridium guangxiense]|uniref:NERD domain-containing protein n=1 Tax=Clostridium guangxiense TaxID=1662055 RepID=UPI001E4F2788|nr:NERD domain-containing protein [Clostridium guangxiense]MCD2345855.1 NERD domain-containing protein [Clostridium guangxiense]